MNSRTIYYNLLVLILRCIVVAAIVSGAWLAYKKLPGNAQNGNLTQPGEATTIEIVLRPDKELDAPRLDVAVAIYPIDIVAVTHEYYADRRAGERFDDFLKLRMSGRSTISGRFDPQGHATVVVPRGSWWIHATLSGRDNLEWRLPVKISGRKQIVELTSRNAYDHTRVF